MFISHLIIVLKILRLIFWFLCLGYSFMMWRHPNISIHCLKIQTSCNFMCGCPLICKIFHPRTTTEHVCIFIFKYLFYLYLHYLTANFRSFIRMSSLFCVDDVMTKAQNSVKISYLWEECPYWEFGSLTGIPPHIVTYVNQEIIIKKIYDGFTRFTTVMQEDLD